MASGVRSDLVAQSAELCDCLWNCADVPTLRRVLWAKKKSTEVSEELAATFFRIKWGYFVKVNFYKIDITRGVGFEFRQRQGYSLPLCSYRVCPPPNLLSSGFWEKRPDHSPSAIDVRKTAWSFTSMIALHLHGERLGRVGIFAFLYLVKDWHRQVNFMW
jgi:hypothetical protein